MMINTILCGNALEELAKLESDSIDLIITSPPYFGQRRYTEEDHDRELGRESSTDQYLDRLFLVFTECVRVCKPVGSIVFNLGDKYIGGSLQLIPYQFALRMLSRLPVKLINEITWVKSNPTPRQYNKRLISSTEPFFHFVFSDDYYYNIDGFLRTEKKDIKVTGKKGFKYYGLIESSDLSEDEKGDAANAVSQARGEMSRGEITDFRMKIRGIHKKAYGGQTGGRNNQIDNQGYTVIKFKGGRIKRDVIETPVANTKNIAHPAVFPLKVITELVSLLSKENGIVLDPFCGSGQVCMAAKSLNRQYLGIDLNPDYCQLAESRLARFPEK